MNKTDVLIVGGGPCGLASAVGASKTGVKVTILERASRLGGILNQCIHNGFGLHLFNEELTGPEYAHRWSEKVSEYKNVQVFTNTFCEEISPIENGFYVCASSEQGLLEFEAKAVILALGCREKPAGSIMLGGTRPAGIFSAGCAQRLINIEGKKVGDKVAILGSGDIGLIMARRLICEGSQVVGIYEIMPQSGGLARNITQCVKDFNIPLHLSTTVTRVVGEKRVQGVYVAPVNERLQPVLELEKFVPCDTLLLSVGLLPENEICANLNLEWNNITNSFSVDEYYQTTQQGLFCAGNVLHVNDLVDNVSSEGEKAGFFAGEFVKNGLSTKNKIEITHDEHIKYTAPKYIYKNDTSVSIAFRVDKNYKRVLINAISGGQEISKKPAPAITAGEMQTITIDKSKIINDLHLQITVLDEK